MIDIKTLKIRILGEDGYFRTAIYDENGMLVRYSGFANDFEPETINIININATAQEIIDDVDSWSHIPWD